MADIPKISGRDPRTIVSTRFALRVKKDSGIVLSPADEGELRMLDTIISKLIDERPATATAPATAVPRPGINPAFKFGVDIICKALNATKPQPMEILAAAARPSPPQPTRRVPPPTVVAVAAAAAAATAIKPAHEIRLVDSTTRAPDAIKKPLALPMPREAPSAAAATDIAHQFAEANEVLTPLEFARHHNLAVLFNTVTDWSPEDVAECDGEGPPTLDTRARRAFAVAKKRQMEFVREFETLTDYLDHDIVIDPLLKLYHEEHPDLVETCKEEIKAARGNDDVNSATAELKKLILTHAITSPVETYITSRDRALFECLSKSYPQLAPKFREIGVTDMSVSALSELPDDVKTKLHMLSATFLQHDRQLAAAFSRIESVAPKMIEWEAAHPQLIQQQKWALAQDILEHPDRTVAEANKQLRAFIIAQLPSPTLPPPVNLHQKGIPAAGLPLKMATDKTPFRSYIDAAAKADIEAAHRKCQGTIRAAIQTTAGNPQTLKTTTFKAHDELMTNVSSAYYHLVGRYSGNPAAAGCAEALSAYERQLLRFDISRDENDKAINGWRTSLFESAPAADSNKGEGGVVDYYVGFRRHGNGAHTVQACCRCHTRAAVGRCGKCLTAHYCSTACQRAHWNLQGHSLICPGQH